MRKIELMHKTFGTAAGICKDCFNFIPAMGGYSKCRIYGLSHSEATDWSYRFSACGKKNKMYHGGSVVKLVTPEKRTDVMEGQISLFDIGGAADG